jgi:hypothetical protein
VGYAYRTLAKKDELTPENIRLSQIMGWCVEMVREECDYLQNFAYCLSIVGNSKVFKTEF